MEAVLYHISFIYQVFLFNAALLDHAAATQHFWITQQQRSTSGSRSSNAALLDHAAATRHFWITQQQRGGGSIKAPEASTVRRQP
jgi:hypothetical protein